MLSNLLTIDGRMGRARYARLTLVAMVLVTLGAILLIFPWAMKAANGIELVPVGLSAALGLAQIAFGLWIAIASSIRRMHDIGWNALWLLVCVIPVDLIAIPAVIVLSLAMTFMRGMAGENPHGPPIIRHAD